VSKASPLLTLRNEPLTRRVVTTMNRRMSQSASSQLFRAEASAARNGDDYPTTLRAAASSAKSELRAEGA